jgi:hypothetical protein
MATQLRRYVINKGEMDAFVGAWRAGVCPLRRRYGFTIHGAWILRTRNEFVWIISYPGTVEEFEAREQVYYGSADRAAVSPNPAVLIARSEQWFVDPVVDNSH